MLIVYLLIFSYLAAYFLQMLRPNRVTGNDSVMICIAGVTCFAAFLGTVGSESTSVWALALRWAVGLPVLWFGSYCLNVGLGSQRQRPAQS